MWPFRRKPLLDDDTASWHAANFAWLIAEFGSESFIAQDLLLPHAKMLRLNGEEDHAYALRVLEQVKEDCSMGPSWPVTLVADDDPAAQGNLPEDSPVSGEYNQGTFLLTDEAAQITYAPALLGNPQRLVTVFAHELAHYLLTTCQSQPPCTVDEREMLIDLTGVFLGFGVFMANSVFSFESPDKWWNLGRSGYLPEEGLVFALALFIAAKRIPAKEVTPYLKPHLAKQIKHALRDLAREPRWLNQVKAKLAVAD
ncbi:MAG TPA: hypothetical protein VFB45_05470 [Pseudolabrys sp.]|nr:hypothetical protein [Pseudolabrys sp.]